MIMNEKILKELIHDAKKGSAEAFGKLYSEYAADLYRFALYYLHSEADAEDAVQDAAVTAFRNIKNLRKPEAFKSWFFKILSNECKKYLIKKTKRNEDLTDEFPTLADSFVNDTSQSLELTELLETLPDTDRLIVILSVLEGYNSKEIADITDIKANTVRSRLSRALHKLREEIEAAER